MATNALERAVLEAARKFIQTWKGPDARDLRLAVGALEAWEQTQDPTVTERGWHEVAEGDELRSVKNGKFYKITRTLKVKGGYEITLEGVPKTITRPTIAEPSATVRRGATGDAIDLLGHVFSSGPVRAS
jgi:hypothetical protein